MSDVQRLHYFNHQFLNEKDFQDEQDYQISMRRRLTKSLHKWGVAEGLKVEQKGDREIVVRPGIAIDRNGREIILANEIEHQMAPSGGSAFVFITITYHEEFREEDRQNASEAESYQRVSEVPIIHSREQPPPDEEGIVLILARVHLDGSGKIKKLDELGRQTAGVAINRGAIGTEELAEDSVTEDKLAPQLRASFGVKGWYRFSFVPHRIQTRRMARDSGGVVLLNEEFARDIAFAHCGSRGAKGAMPIPVPPGATKIKAFRITGNTRGTVTAQLIWTGWNVQDNKGETGELLNISMNEGTFNSLTKVEGDLSHLDQHFQTLALSVTAEKESEIWLVAVEFE